MFVREHYQMQRKQVMTPHRNVSILLFVLVSVSHTNRGMMTSAATWFSVNLSLLSSTRLLSPLWTPLRVFSTTHCYKQHSASQMSSENHGSKAWCLLWDYWDSVEVLEGGV
jgi:hypothetical protein